MCTLLCWNNIFIISQIINPYKVAFGSHPFVVITELTIRTTPHPLWWSRAVPVKLAVLVINFMDWRWQWMPYCILYCNTWRSVLQISHPGSTLAGTKYITNITSIRGVQYERVGMWRLLEGRMDSVSFV